jgi:hypothetical protein
MVGDAIYGMTTFRPFMPSRRQPAVVGSLAVRPLALRPRLSAALPLAQRE